MKRIEACAQVPKFFKDFWDPKGSTGKKPVQGGNERPEVRGRPVSEPLTVT